MDVRSWWLGFDVARCDLERHLLLWRVPTLAVATAGTDSPGGNSRADVGLWGDRVLGVVSAFRSGDGVDRINDGCDELNAKIPSSSDERINEYNGFQVTYSRRSPRARARASCQLHPTVRILGKL